ncbi:MAG: PAS domain-containing protein, partial [Rubrobacteraceae bacterium]
MRVAAGSIPFQETGAMYEALVNQVPAVVYVDADDEVSSALFMSPQVEEMLGYTQEEWLEDPGLWVKLLHPEDRERVLAEANRTPKTEEPFEAEYRLIARDGRTVWVHDNA